MKRWGRISFWVLVIGFIASISLAASDNSSSDGHTYTFSGCGGGGASKSPQPPPPPPDTIPPSVVGFSPCDNGAWVPIDSTISIRTNDILKPSSVNSSTFFLTDEFDQHVVGTISVEYGLATFNPSELLSPNTTYNVVVTTGIKDYSDNPLELEKRWSFTTGPIGVGTWERLSKSPDRFRRRWLQPTCCLFHRK